MIKIGTTIFITAFLMGLVFSQMSCGKKDEATTTSNTMPTKVSTDVL